MSALIGMAIFSTKENGKDKYLEQTLESLKTTVDFSEHRLMLSINAYTEETEHIMWRYRDIIHGKIWNNTNIGTAEAINHVWKDRKPNENAVKIDDDIVIHTPGWITLAEQIIKCDPWIGQVGLRRKDLRESPSDPDPFYRSEDVFLELTSGRQRVEKCNHIMGSCVLHSAKLLDNIGYLWQPQLYGFDDALMSRRSGLAGFKNVFIPCDTVEIDHVDPGETPYQKWKENHAMKECWDAYQQAAREFDSGKRSVYYNPFEK